MAMLEYRRVLFLVTVFVEFFLDGMNGLFPLETRSTEAMESMSWWLKLRGYLGQLAKTAHSERRARKHAQKTSQRDGRRTNRDYSKIDDFGWLYSCTLVHQKYNYTYKATAQPTSVLSDATGPTECCRLVDSHFVFRHIPWFWNS